jgi:hypothetical protein
MFSRWEWRGARALFLPVLKVQEPAVEVGAAAQRDIPKPRNPTGEGMDDGKESKLAIKGEGSGWTGGKRAATFFDDCRPGLFPVRGHGYGRVLGSSESARGRTGWVGSENEGDGMIGGSVHWSDAWRGCRGARARLCTARKG